MTLKFDVREDMGGYSLHIDTAQTNIEVGATEGELRRLMVDLMHELLQRAEQYHGECGQPTIAMEMADAADFVASELVDDDPEVSADE